MFTLMTMVITGSPKSGLDQLGGFKSEMEKYGWCVYDCMKAFESCKRKGVTHGRARAPAPAPPGALGRAGRVDHADVYKRSAGFEINITTRVLLRVHTRRMRPHVSA
ncbi:hypothetical protein EVAR_98164_1 [Eumeta japonica]|uniref:Uncharacterized protein n=1 Tax=Eumeta variegata TaxID=151549 RepID=A0A4C1YFE3_EUMVA|nr:hypothetical protein EVAR_98164_1 [Eumeta japonica]